MSHKISLKISGALAVSCMLAAIAASPVAAASPNKTGRTVPVAHRFSSPLRLRWARDSSPCDLASRT